MHFIVECQLKAGTKNQAVAQFEKVGPNRHQGVTFRGAWIGAHKDVAFVVVESAEESLVTAAAKSWAGLDGFQITEVVNVEQF